MTERALAKPLESDRAGAASQSPLGVRRVADQGPRLAGLTSRQWVGLAALVVAVQTPFFVYVLRGQAPVTSTVPFFDDFNRAEVGPSYFTIGGHWRVENGLLHSPGVKNNPLWLKARLPDNVVVEFDVKSESADGDIKCEIFGNGRDHASGYIIVFGGWSNSTSVMARLDEHGRDRKENRDLRVDKGRLYHFRIERNGTLLRWFADNRLLMEYDDPKPLHGPGHDRFGFSSWEADLYFDNLSIHSL
jgi:hypothetical protein